MKTPLVDREEVATDTMAFYFEKPAEFDFKAGRAADITLIDPPETDAEGNTRTFSVASAPYEERVMIATRMRDTAFKRVLKALPLGTEVELTEPTGSLTLHNDISKRAVFLIGGIGITPVRSIVLDATHRQLPHRLTLFYSNRQPAAAAFLDELTDLQGKNKHFELVATMTQLDSSSKWGGETGYITAAMIRRYVDRLDDVIWYLAGPAVMVKAMREVLAELNIDDDFVRTEEFPGY